MSRAHHILLKKICHREETLERAKAILHTASIKTAQGSGYELGPGLSGLPAICAYIAAQELGDTDVTEHVAQASSCLKPKVFKTTLNTVKAALAAASTPAASPAKSARRVTYTMLLNEKKIGRKGLVVGWMQDAERTLMANLETRRRFAGAYEAITIAVFCWTCQLMGTKQKVDAEALLDRYDVPWDQFNEITEALHESCQDNAQKIKADIAALKEKASPAKPVVSPSKPPTQASPTKPPRQQPTLPRALPPPTPSRAAALTRSPSKSALRAPSADLSPRKTPSHKRKVAFDGPLAEADEGEFDALATPSKRQKFSSPIKELATPAPAAGTPRKSSRLAQSAVSEEREGELPVPSSSREMLELLQRARSGDAASVPSTPRRPRVASQPSSTHSTRSARSGRSQPTTPSRRKPALPTVHEDEERVGRRRYRPAFADTQQWLRGDARLERSLRPWRERWQELVGRCGGDIWEAAKVASQERRGAGVVSIAS